MSLTEAASLVRFEGSRVEGGAAALATLLAMDGRQPPGDRELGLAVVWLDRSLR
ncbi:hypothetical protein ACP70R_033083 [Stipagrostis hirtigluma subsp. patula]